jgi:hypothetical protein
MSYTKRPCKPPWHGTAAAQQLLLTVCQLANKFPAPYDTRTFTAVTPWAANKHYPVPRAPTPLPHAALFLQTQFNIILPPTTRSQYGFFHSGFRNKILYLSCLHSCYIIAPLTLMISAWAHRLTFCSLPLHPTFLKHCEHATVCVARLHGLRRAPAVCSSKHRCLHFLSRAKSPATISVSSRCTAGRTRRGGAGRRKRRGSSHFIIRHKQEING